MSLSGVTSGKSQVQYTRPVFVTTEYRNTSAPLQFGPGGQADGKFHLNRNDTGVPQGYTTSKIIGRTERPIT